MTRAGRPLRFMATVLGGWILLRLLLLGADVGFLPTGLRFPGQEGAIPAPVVAQVPVRPLLARLAPVLLPLASPAAPVESRQAAFTLPRSPGLSEAARTLLEYGLLAPSTAVAVPVDAAIEIAPETAALSGSAWVVARGSGEGAGAATPQLGGGQAGVRLVRTLDARHRVAAAGRVTTPLDGPGQEAALGVEWQPTRLPVRLVAEQRLGIDTRAGGPTLAMVGGTGPQPVAAGFGLESYGAAGAIGRDGLQLFAEGSVRLARPAGRIGKSALAVGAGAWGATQPGAARVDIGPSVELAVPVSGRRLRLIADWRERVGGDARPGSGPVLTLATDF